MWHFRVRKLNRRKLCRTVYSASTTDPPRSGLRQVTADPIPKPLLAPPSRPRGRPPPGLHFGMGLLSMGRSWPRPKAVRRLHRMGGAPRSRRSHVRRCLQPPGSDVARLSAAIGAGGKPFGLSKLTFTHGEGAAARALLHIPYETSIPPSLRPRRAHRPPLTRRSRLRGLPTLVREEYD